MKISKNFYAQEFVPLDYWEEFQEASMAAIDDRIIITVQALRDNIGYPLTINTWHSGGERYESGLRVWGMKNYSVLSQHTYGRAVDIICDQYLAQELRDHILKNPRKYPHITRMEDRVSWLHIDLKDTGQGNIVLFEPSNRFNYEFF